MAFPRPKSRYFVSLLAAIWRDNIPDYRPLGICSSIQTRPMREEFLKSMLSREAQSRRIRTKMTFVVAGVNDKWFDRYPVFINNNLSAKLRVVAFLNWNLSWGKHATMTVTHPLRIWINNGLRRLPKHYFQVLCDLKYWADLCLSALTVIDQDTHVGLSKSKCKYTVKRYYCTITRHIMFAMNRYLSYTLDISGSELSRPSTSLHCINMVVGKISELPFFPTVCCGQLSAASTSRTGCLLALVTLPTEGACVRIAKFFK